MKTLIIGSGVSCKAVYKYLKDKKCSCEILEKFTESSELFDKLESGKFSRVIVSPGIKLDKNIIFQLKKRKIALYGEMEFGMSKINNKIIAVTGTNGKTTTVSLIGYLLRKYLSGSCVAGNIGVPITSLINKLNDEVVVLECSSFQLETINKFSPHIAVILNISEDHLNRHKTMKEYIRCKYKITKNQTEKDFLLLNADDDYLFNNSPKTKAKIYYFSTKNKVFGVYLKNKIAYFFDGIKEVK